jgi:hypothetical protein
MLWLINTAFLVDSKFNHMVKNFTPINERHCVIRIKGRFLTYALINIHAPSNDSEEGSILWTAKTGIHSLPKSWRKVGDVRRLLKKWLENRTSANDKQVQPTCSTNENGLRLVDFAAGRQMAIKLNYVLHTQTNPPRNLALPRWTHLQPDRSLLNRRKTLFWRHRWYDAEGCNHATVFPRIQRLLVSSLYSYEK